MDNTKKIEAKDNKETQVEVTNNEFKEELLSIDRVTRVTA